MKKILSVFLSVLLLFTMMPVSIMGVAAEDTPAISLVAPEQAIAIGDTFTVDVVMAGNPGIICWRTCVAYDSAVLELVDQTAGDAFGITYMSFGPLRSPASAMWCDAIGGNVTANGVMYTLTFRVPADAAAGTYPLTLSVLYPEDDILNSDLEAVYFDLVSTTVTVVDHYHAYDNACDYDCNICGDVREVEPHNYVGRIEIAPTCVDEGVMRHTCTVCGDNFTVAIPAAGHEYNAVVTAPTCESAGYTTHTCANCGDSYVDAEVAAVGHAYQSAVTAPTCESAGYTTHTCTRCGDSYVDAEVAALGHAYESVVTIAPTCTEDGVKTYTCQNCGSSYIEAIPAVGHDYSAVVTAPTCESAGYTTHTCANCGDSYVDAEVAALGHAYESVVTIAPTCTEDGVKTYTCQNCGGSHTEAIPAVGHDYSAVVTAPTCESAGYTTHTCANCGDSYVDAEVAALGHAYESVVTIAPTCTEDGVKTYTCRNCGSSYIEAIPANGEHTYGHACSESCSVCGAANDGAAAHTYSHVYDVDCDVCGAVREVTILMGDLNGDGKVNIRDLGLLQQYLNGWEVTILADVADLNADGKINIRDLGLFQQYLNGWDVNLGG